MAIGLWLITSFGAKGIGEDGAVGPPAAIVSAVNDNLPLSPQRILDAIETAPAAKREERPYAQSSTL
jgi:carbon-monoxide dehydrogenase large subunit